jgi:transposase
MREAKTRNFHTAEFKAKVGLEAIRGVKTINEIGQEYGVHPVTVGHWKKETQDQAKKLFEGSRGPKPIAAHSHPERLFSEIGRLKVELDWLKKNLGSVGCNPPSLGGQRGRSADIPAMCAGRRLPSNDL